MRASQIYFWCPLNAIYRISKDTPIDVQMYSVSKHPVLYHGKGTAIHWCGSCGFYFDSERAGDLSSWVPGKITALMLVPCRVQWAGNISDVVNHLSRSYHLQGCCLSEVYCLLVWLAERELSL